MTEAEWLTSTNLRQHLQFLRGRVSERKLRHLMSVYVRGILSVFSDPGSEEADEALELFPTGALSRSELDRVFSTSKSQILEMHGWPWRTEGQRESLMEDVESAVMWALLWYLPIDAVVYGDDRCWRLIQDDDPSTVPYKARCSAISVLREVVGNPFRRVIANPAWLTPDVVALAKDCYSHGDFTTMPILADALEDAGCDSEDILSHCRDRDPADHVRGCWVVDLVLGKE